MHPTDSKFARHLISCHFSKLDCQACPLCNRPFSKITGGGAVCALQFGAGFMDSWIPPLRNELASNDLAIAQGRQGLKRLSLVVLCRIVPCP